MQHSASKCKKKKNAKSFILNNPLTFKLSPSLTVYANLIIHFAITRTILNTYINDVEMNFNLELTKRKYARSKAIKFSKHDVLTLGILFMRI